MYRQTEEEIGPTVRFPHHVIQRTVYIGNTVFELHTYRI